MPTALLPRVGCIVAASTFAGAAIGFIGVAIAAPFAAVFGLAVGACVGVICSPALVAAVVKKPLRLGIPLVVIPAAATSVLGGLSGSPLLTLLSVLVYLAMAVVCAALLPDLPRRLGVCVQCGYLVGTLPRCPECGTDREHSSPAPPSTTTPLVRTLIAGCSLACVVLLTATTAYFAWERIRPRTPEGRIEELSTRDMQRSWEARQAVVRDARREGPARLIGALGHPDAGVRMNAAWALELLADPAAREGLTVALEDPDPYVRQHARDALAALPD